MSRRPLTSRAGVPKCRDARRPDGRFPPRAERGKSGLHGGAVPGNARRGRPQGKCHRKYTAGPSRDTRRPARVKWCGKSAPRRRQRRRQGKPHREQDQVGAAGTPDVSGARRDLRVAVRVGCMRRSVTGVQEEWPSPPTCSRAWAGQNPAYRPSGTISRIIEHIKNVSCLLCAPSPRQLHEVVSGSLVRAPKKSSVLFIKPIDDHLVP
jgi:hypothetical protein